MELTLQQRLRKRFSFDRLSRLQGHYFALKPVLDGMKAKDKADVVFFSAKFEEYYRRAKRLSNVRLVVYALLLAGVLVSLIDMIIHFLFGNAIYSTIISAIPVALIFVLNARINLHLQTMQICLMHLSALYQKNPARNGADLVKDLNRII